MGRTVNPCLAAPSKGKEAAVLCWGQVVSPPDGEGDSSGREVCRWRRFTLRKDVPPVPPEYLLAQTSLGGNYRILNKSK